MQYSIDQVKYYMEEVRNKIVAYLEEEVEILEAALKPYEEIADEDWTIKKEKVVPTEIQAMREVEAIKLRDRIRELKRHVAVIKRMIV